MKMMLNKVFVVLFCLSLSACSTPIVIEDRSLVNDIPKEAALRYLQSSIIEELFSLRPTNSFPCSTMTEQGVGMRKSLIPYSDSSYHVKLYGAKYVYITIQGPGGYYNPPFALSEPICMIILKKQPEKSRESFLAVSKKIMLALEALGVKPVEVKQ